MDQLFIPITKIDEERREVWGTATEEILDRDGEILDYASSKPHFQDWSAEVAKSTDGKSLGNIRAMHQPIAAGKIIAMNCDDAGKRIEIGTKIVDDAEWDKCREGVYTGFSAGGKYVRKWNDPENPKLRRYEAVPHEISLVDLPAVPTATFSLVKMGGAVETRRFQKVAARDDTSPKEGKDKYGDVEFADAKNKKYPLDTKAHVRNALARWGDEKNRAKYSAEDQKTIGAKIQAAAKKMGIEVSEKAVLSGDFAKTYAKGLWELSRLADLAQNLVFLQEGTEAERAFEGDDSTVPDDLKGHVEGLLGCLEDMAQEEISELLARLKGTSDKAAKAAHATKAAPTTTATTATRTTAMPETFRKLSKTKLDGLHAIIEHGNAVHTLFGNHVEKMADGEDKTACKSFHTMLGDHMDKLEGFHAEVGGLPTTESEGSEEHEVTGKLAKVTTDLGEVQKRFAAVEVEKAALEKRATDAETQVKAVEKERDEALDLGEKLLEQRKGTLILVGHDDPVGALTKSPKKDDKPEEQLTEREKLHKVFKAQLRKPMIDSGFGEPMALANE